MLYCSREHQVAHHVDHKVACNAVKQKRDHLENEERALRADPGDGGFMQPANVFDNSVGHFWGILGTRDYMRARYALIEALRKVSTFDATQESLDHCLDILRLNRSDNMGVRDLVPVLFLRLGRDQECYDFVKWFQTIGQDGDYDWGDMSLPFLHIKNADPFEPVEYLCGKYPDLSHVAAIALLKIKLLVDLQALQNTGNLELFFPAEIAQHIQRYVVRSPIMLSKKGVMMDPADCQLQIEVLSVQFDRLYKAVYQANRHFWQALLSPKNHLKARPESFSSGSIEQMQLILQSSIDAWTETYGAIPLIKRFTDAFNIALSAMPPTGWTF